MLLLEDTLYDALELLRNQSCILSELLSPCPILRDPDPRIIPAFSKVTVIEDIQITLSSPCEHF